MKNNLSTLFPFLLGADLIIPFLLAPTCKGYHHLTQVMSVLGSSQAPLHIIYNTWLVVFGITILFCGFQLYPAIAKISNAAAALFLFIITIYAVGGCILSGIFPVGETKSLETLSAKVHGYGSAAGFFFLAFAPLLVGWYYFKTSNGSWGALSLMCFVLAVGFFVLFVMADKPNSQGTVLALEGLWQRASLLFMYVPIAMLSISNCR